VTGTVLQTLGGLGLFLLGMVVLTDGLKALAGGAIRTALKRFTHSPYSGAVTGMAATTVLQSSSATTVAAVGFVGAGLLTFPEALGIVFGANIGTTVKGWLVAIIGFKLKLGQLSLFLVLTGVALRLFAGGRLASVGMAIAGFGLIFVGIGSMQEGMLGLQHIITPAHLPADTLAGRLMLVGFGILFTVITQSSSAGVVTSLTALSVGSISFHQAAAMVIGMDIGTTVTAAMAAIGGSVGSRRTGLSHVIYNLMTGIGALFLLTPYVLLWQWLAPGQLSQNAEIALVGFHSSFNIIGVLVVLPFTHQFARFVERLIPDHLPAYTASLNPALLKEPEVALTAVVASTRAELLVMLSYIKVILGEQRVIEKGKLIELQNALDETHHYLDRIHLSADSGKDWSRLVALIHALDHMQRLEDRCEEKRTLPEEYTFADLATYHVILLSALTELIVTIEEDDWNKAAGDATRVNYMIYEWVESLRDHVMCDVAAGKLDVTLATRTLESIRWIQRVSSHINKITNYLNETWQPRTG